PSATPLAAPNPGPAPEPGDDDQGDNEDKRDDSLRQMAHLVAPQTAPAANDFGPASLMGTGSGATVDTGAGDLDRTGREAVPTRSFVGQVAGTGEDDARAAVAQRDGVDHQLAKQNKGVGSGTPHGHDEDTVATDVIGEMNFGT